MRLLLAWTVSQFLLAGCTKGPSSATDGGATDLAPSNALVIARPYQSVVPIGYDPSKPTPLVILLHGYSANGAAQDALFGLSRYVDTGGFLYAYPDGTIDQMGNHFWNATDACCDFFHTGVDDVAYLNAVIDDMSAHYNVDKKRVFLTGHSNGGYMSHRMACDSASRIAAIVALAGDNWKDVTRCKPSDRVAVLQVHGTADMSVLYNGDANSPSAMASIGSWVTFDGCGPTPDTSSPPLDIDATVPGAETTLSRWTGCKPGGAAELWTLHGSSHIPALRSNWSQLIYSFMMAHPKP